MVQRIGIESVAFYIPIFSTTCFYSSAALAVLIYTRPPHRLTLSDSGMILKNASVTSSGEKKLKFMRAHFFLYSLPSRLPSGVMFSQLPVNVPLSVGHPSQQHHHHSGHLCHPCQQHHHRHYMMTIMTMAPKSALTLTKRQLARLTVVGSFLKK